MTVLHRIIKISSKISWKIWAVLLIVVPGTIGFTSTLILLNFLRTPKCTHVFLPITSVSTKIHCAQIEAKKNTLKGFLKAIKLSKSFPKKHSFRSEVEHNVKKWTIAILDIAEEKFQQGQLQEAINIAERIPNNVQTNNIVSQRIEKWNNSWSEGEEILVRIESQLRNFSWNLAFKEVLKLHDLPNKYWATTGYNDAVKKIRFAKEESSQLDNAFILLNRGGVDNWLSTINESQQINFDSYAYQKAQDLIQDAEYKINDHINELIDNDNWSTLSKVIDKTSNNKIFINKTRDLLIITNAGLETKKGTIESVKNAILKLEKINLNSSFYQRSKNLSDIWKSNIKYIAYLEKSRKLAIRGNIEDLKEAIQLAKIIPSDNFYYQEAREEIDKWNSLVQTKEDKPILDKAKHLAAGGDILDLKRAIVEIQSIGMNRTLSIQAKEEAQKWYLDIKRQKDQLILNQAVILGNNKNYVSAIIIAKKITSERPLYKRAQNNIKKWQTEIKAKEDLKKAYLMAQSQTSQSLISAISIIQNIPLSTDVSSQAKQSLKRWSFQILSIAENLANRSLWNEAIEVANKIPEESPVYSSAQAKILTWNNFLK